jgi:hypothetical protein
MMFDQNVWHRGAANQDPSNPINRVMFIVTFLSRTKDTPGDRRYQGLGTYFYQRWNMWGHTYKDLKDAATSMAQPFAALRALGLWKSKGRKWGVTFIEQFAQQIANRDHFYASYELPPFLEFLDSIGVPKFLRGTSTHWEPFIEETLHNSVVWLTRMNILAVGIYFGIRVVLWILQLVIGTRSKNASEGSSQRRRQLTIPSFLKRIILTHGAVLLIAAALQGWIDQTDLALRAKSKAVFIRPFAEPLLDEDGTSIGWPGLGPTTFPERSDVLIGTRYDADSLGSYNGALNYHPGNIRFASLLAGFSGLPPALLEDSSKSLVKFIHENIDGVSPRFLMQDPTDGYWTLMPDSEALKVARRAILMEQSGLKKTLGKHLASVLADSRFGQMRSTDLSGSFNPLFVTKWENVVFGPAINSTSDASESDGKKAGVRTPRRRLIVTPPRVRSEASFSATTRKGSIQHELILRRDNLDNLGLQVGDRVLGHVQLNGWWLEGKIIYVYDKETCLVAYKDGTFANLPIRSIRRYESFVEGDIVESEYEGQAGKWFQAKISKVHPLGSCNVHYVDGDMDLYIATTGVRKISPPPLPISLRVDPETRYENGFFQGQRIKANYMNTGEYFDGYVMHVNADGTYDLLFRDGDSEKGVRREKIVPFSSLKEGFVPFQRIKGNYLNEGKWYEAFIVAVNDNGTYDINYVDGDRGRGVRVEMIVPLFS